MFLRGSEVLRSMEASRRTPSPPSFYYSSITFLLPFLYLHVIYSRSLCGSPLHILLTLAQTSMKMYGGEVGRREKGTEKGRRGEREGSEERRERRERKTLTYIIVMLVKMMILFVVVSVTSQVCIYRIAYASLPTFSALLFYLPSLFFLLYPSPVSFLFSSFHPQLPPPCNLLFDSPCVSSPFSSPSLLSSLLPSFLSSLTHLSASLYQIPMGQ